MPLQFFSPDLESDKREIIVDFQNRINEVLYPGDERRLFLEAFIGFLSAWKVKTNDQIKQSYLRYARGEVLDAIGETRAVERIQAGSSKTTLRFFVKAPKTFNILIPRGTRASNDGQRFFATDYNAVLMAGENSVDIDATATETGTSFNGIHAGEIVLLNDKVPNIDSVINLDDTHGGRDQEDDESYRERIRLSPNAWSTAGPAQAYRSFALEGSNVADALVIQDYETITVSLPVYDGCAFFPTDRVVKIESEYEYSIENEMYKFDCPGQEQIEVTFRRNLKGVVLIVPICKGGIIPDEEVLREVEEACTRPDRKPLTDKVIVRAPEPVPYDIELVYYTTKDRESLVIENIEGSNGAIQRYIQWQDETMNNDINPDMLRKLCLCPDWDEDRNAPYRIEVVSPVYTEIDQIQIPKFSGNLKVRHEVIYG